MLKLYLIVKKLCTEEENDGILVLGHGNEIFKKAGLFYVFEIS